MLNFVKRFCKFLAALQRITPIFAKMRKIPQKDLQLCDMCAIIIKLNCGKEALYAKL